MADTYANTYEYLDYPNNYSSEQLRDISEHLSLYLSQYTRMQFLNDGSNGEEILARIKYEALCFLRERYRIHNSTMTVNRDARDPRMCMIQITVDGQMLPAIECVFT